MRTLLSLALASGAAALQNWTILNTWQAIAVASDQVDGKTGYVGAGVNGEGYQLWKTVDNWNTITPTVFSDALIFTDVASYANNVQIIGALDFFYSTDGGVTFKNSSILPGASESVAPIGPKEAEIGFGMAGSWAVTLLNQDNGVAVSYNNGANYTVSNVTTINAFARYGEFPSDQTWFLTAGWFPGEDSDDNSGSTTSGGPSSTVAAGQYIVNREHYINAEQIPEGSTFVKAHGARAHILRSPKGDKNIFAVVKKEVIIEANVAPKAPLGGGPNITTYYDQIAKTTDGGKTWSLVYNLFNQNYGNHISCFSETHCCMAYEAPGVVGAGILCTFDGETFTQTYNNPDPYSSIVGISALSEDIWWAGGGELTQLGVQNSQFYMSTDGGKTWSKDSNGMFSQLYAIDIDCVPSQGSCWATLLNQATQSFSVAQLTA